VQSRSLLVYYGLKNDGATRISQRLQGKHFSFPVGISVAKTNSPATVGTTEGIADYVQAHSALASIGQYTTINISCPNAYGGQPFTDPESLDQLLVAIDNVETTKPVLVKFSPDLPMAVVDQLLAVLAKHKVAGIITTNLTKNRDNQKLLDVDLPLTGGYSGKVVEALSNEMLAHIYRVVGRKYILIGCGGIFSAEDAYRKIRLGASLLQLITGMVFEGPQLIGEINRGLVRLLKRDGYRTISEAVGVDVR
jgi:dihydroorotate dehydrogenase